MGARKARKAPSVAGPSVIGRRIGIAFGTDGVPVAFVSVPTSNGNNLEVTDGAFDAGAGIVFVAALRRFGTELSLQWHHPPVLTSFANEEPSREVPAVNVAMPSTTMVTTLLLQGHASLTPAAFSKVCL